MGKTDSLALCEAEIEFVGGRQQIPFAGYRIRGLDVRLEKPSLGTCAWLLWYLVEFSEPSGSNEGLL